MEKCPSGYLYTCRNWLRAGARVQNACLKLIRCYLCFDIRVAGLPRAVWKAVPSSTPSSRERGEEVHYLRPIIPFSEQIQASMSPQLRFKIYVTRLLHHCCWSDPSTSALS